MTTASPSTRAWGWVALSALAFVLAEVATIPVIWVAESMLGLPHAAGLALWTISRILLSGVAILVIGRILLRPPARSGGLARMVLGIGAGLSALVWVALLSWSELQFGYFEPDALGITRHLYAVVGLTAVAGFATLVAPDDATRPPMVATVIALLLTLVIVVANAPGAADGVAPESVPLGVTIGMTLVYGLAVVSLAYRRFARSSQRTSGEPDAGRGTLHR